MEIWKGFESGGVKSDAVLSDMLAKKIRIGTWVQVATKELATSPRTSTNFTRCEVRDLGFRRRPTTKQLWERVAEVGEICRKDDGLHLRYNFLEQGDGDCLFVVMEFINWPSPEGKCIFCLSCGKDDEHRRQLRFQICPVDIIASWPLKHQITFRV